MAREYRVSEKPMMPPVHPGEILREDGLPALRLSVSEAARQLRVAEALERLAALDGTWAS